MDVRNDGHFIDISDLDADWYLAQDRPLDARDGIKVRSMAFYPSANTDILVVKNSLTGVATTPTIARFTAAYSDLLVRTFAGDGVWMAPFIDISDATLDTPANCRIIIELADG